MGGKSDNLKNFTSWEHQNLDIFKKDGEKTIRMVTEWNQCYGELIKSFQFGDESGDTGVKCRYTGNMLKLMEQDSLCGEREFENGSITYEFLYKPCGFPMPTGNARTSFYEFKHFLIGRGYVHTRKY
jgi:hypothetical protein